MKFYFPRTFFRLAELHFILAKPDDYQRVELTGLDRQVKQQQSCVTTPGHAVHQQLASKAVTD